MSARRRGKKPRLPTLQRFLDRHLLWRFQKSERGDFYQSDRIKGARERYRLHGPRISGPFDRVLFAAVSSDSRERRVVGQGFYGVASGGASAPHV